MPSTRRSSSAESSPASGSLSGRTRKEVVLAHAAAATARSPASGSLSRRRTRYEADEVVAPYVAADSDFGKDEEGEDSLSRPNTRRATLRKRSAEGGISSAAGSSSERPRMRMRKEANGVLSAAEDAVEEFVVSEGGTKVEGDSLLRRCTHRQDKPRNRSSGERQPASKSSSKSQSRKGKKAEEIKVLDVDEMTSDEEDLEVEVDEVRFEEEGDDEEIKVGDEVKNSGRKPRVVVIRKSGEDENAECRFIGQPINEKEAKERWPKRYQGKAKVKEKKK